MLLIYTFDKNELRNEEFIDEVMTIDFGYHQPKGTRVKLSMVSFSNESEGQQVFLDFPDLLPRELEKEIGDFSDIWEIPSMAFQAESGSSRANSLDAQHHGRFTGNATTIPLDIDLGRLDHNKHFFSIVVNGRRADGGISNRNRLNNIQVVLEMVHDSVLS